MEGKWLFPGTECDRLLGSHSGSVGSAAPRQQLRTVASAWFVFSRSLSEAALVVTPVGLHLQRENKIKGGILSTQHM